MGRIAALQVGMQSSNFVHLSFSIIQITMKFHCWLSGLKPKSWKTHFLFYAFSITGIFRAVSNNFGMR